MLFQPTNVIPSMFADPQYSTITTAEPVHIEWQVNGNSPMTKAIVKIYTSGANHTQVGSALTIEPSTPFCPTDSKGNPRMFAYEGDSSWASVFSGMSNGNDYLLSIEQFWSASESIEMYAPVAFRARAVPAVTIAQVSELWKGFEQTYTATYSQAQSVPITYVRWILTDGDGNLIDDTGEIYTTQLSYTYDCFNPDTAYILTVKITNDCGQITTATYNIAKWYAMDAFGDTSVRCRPDDTIDVVLPTLDDSDTQFVIIRTDGDGGNAINLGAFPNTTIIVKDYAIQSEKEYIYTLYTVKETQGGLVVSEYTPAKIAKKFTAYTLVECAETSDGEYTFVNIYRFASNVATGSISNNNSPSFLQNFTKYPLRQASKTAPKSGSLQALICNPYMGVYTDNAERMEQLFAISQSPNVFFLKDPKGNIYKVHTSAPITQTVADNSGNQYVTVNIPWQEIGSAKKAVIASAGTSANAVAALEAAERAQTAANTLIPLVYSANLKIKAANAAIKQANDMAATFTKRLEALAGGVFIQRAAVEAVGNE